jgi:hypothetical protein
MLHELQEQQSGGRGKLIALGAFDSRRPIAVAIARRSIRARTTGFGAMRRCLNITRPSQLRGAAIAERRVEAYSRWQGAMGSRGALHACRITSRWSAADSSFGSVDTLI